MPEQSLQRGDKGKQVVRLQKALNKVGAMLMADGDFGSGTRKAVAYAQNIARQPETGIADESLWNWLNDQPEPFSKLNSEGVAFIAREETGGLGYYEQVTQWPHYPGEQSGITIGVGYDLRFNTPDSFQQTWGPWLDAGTMSLLTQDLGKKGTKTRARELKNLGLHVPFKLAWQVLVRDTLPSFYQQTQSIYTSLDSLPLSCRSSLVSLVFNRGTSLSGASRKEMKAIQQVLLRAQDPSLDEIGKFAVLLEIEDLLVDMKRLWDPSSGLIKRRQAEANLWREGLSSMLG